MRSRTRLRGVLDPRNSRKLSEDSSMEDVALRIGGFARRAWGNVEHPMRSAGFNRRSAGRATTRAEQET